MSAPTLIGYFTKRLTTPPSGLRLEGVEEICIAPGPGGWAETSRRSSKQAAASRLTISSSKYVRERSTDGGLVARIATAEGFEEASVWRDGGRLRFQPAPLPVAFDLRPSPTGDTLSGFARFAGHLVHVVLPRGGDGAWAARWSPAGGPLMHPRSRVGHESSSSRARIR